jgi:YfiH family protein
MPSLIEASWPAPRGIRAVSTTRNGGKSEGPFDSLNLGLHVGDEPGRVQENRGLIKQSLELPSDPQWLNQVHSSQAVRPAEGKTQTADAMITETKGTVCVVMTADCLPLLLCSKDGTSVAAVHAGWRGLAQGIVGETIRAIGTSELLAWMGPAIGPESFEVGLDVYSTFSEQEPAFSAAFKPINEGKWLLDIYELTQMVLLREGVSSIYGGGHCTVKERDRFFSYRRERITGRMATLIWRE